MADTKISDMTAAVSVADADLVPVVQGGANKRATAALIRTGLVSESTVRTANTILAGPTTGVAAAATFRALVAADIPSLSYQPVDATLTALASLGAGPGFLQVTAQDTFSIAALSGAQVNTALGYTAANNAALAGLQPLDATLTALAALATLGAANQIIRTNAGATALEWADPAGGISGLTPGVIPVATSGTAIGNSKMVTSGTNSGTWTLYDSTADATGVSTFNIRVGEGQDDSAQWYPLMQILNKATGVPIEVFPLVGTGNGLTTQVATGQVVHNASDQLWVLSTTGLLLEQDAIIGWADVYATASRNVGLANPSTGILKVTDGSTGYGRLLAGTLGVNNSAAGSTPGTCVKKLEIFDAAGTSLGFIPVYDAIT